MASLTPEPDSEPGIRAREAALLLLCKMGWRYLPPAACLAKRGSACRVVLHSSFVDSLKAWSFVYQGDRHHLSSHAITRVAGELDKLSLQNGLMALNRTLYDRLRHGIRVSDIMPDGNSHDVLVPLIDWDNPKANWFEISDRFELAPHQGISAKPHPQLDLVGFVNGIPLAIIAAAANNADAQDVNAGIGAHLQHQGDGSIAQFYAHAQLLLALDQQDGRYATNGTAPKFWARWHDEQFDDAYCAAIKDMPLSIETLDALLADHAASTRHQRKRVWSAPAALTDADRLLIGLMSPQRLLEFIHGFVLFDSKAGKLVARCHQFFAVRALMGRVGTHWPEDRATEGGARKGGVIWHPTGSGKSYTMVFFAEALMRHPDLKQCRIVIVTDRIDLQEQISKNFLRSGAFGAAAGTKLFGESTKVRSGRELARHIGAGSERIIFTLLHKFNAAMMLDRCNNPSSNLIVLVDEAHRTHGGQLHQRMRSVMKRAAFIAFTGTPLLRHEKTASLFGPILHSYTMQRAMDDQMVTPLLYEERIPELGIDTAAVNAWFGKISHGLAPQQRAALQRHFSSKDKIYGAANRIELIAWDIAVHFNENIKQTGLCLKGQLATASKRDAIRYKKYLDQTGMIKSAVIISAPEIDEGEFDSDSLPELRQWWLQHVGNDQQGYEQRALRQFSEPGQLDLLIVVDRLLTGFDAPNNAVLYIDKPLRQHSLIQAIARVNRLHEQKRYAMLVDYRGILKPLDTALRAYQDLEELHLSDYERADIEGTCRQFSTEYRRLPLLHQALTAFFPDARESGGREPYRQVLMPQLAIDCDGDSYDMRGKIRDDFEAVLNRFSHCLAFTLSSRSFIEEPAFTEAEVRRYKSSMRFFNDLRRIARRDVQQANGQTLPPPTMRKRAGPLVHALAVRQNRAHYLLRQQTEGNANTLGDPHAHASRWSVERTINESALIHARITHSIGHELADDPYAQKMFAETLLHTVEQTKNACADPLAQYAIWQAFAQQVSLREVDGVPPMLDGQRHARVCFGIFRLVLGDAHFAAASEDDIANYARKAQEVEQIVLRQVITAKSLMSKGEEASLRQALLPFLHSFCAWGKVLKIVDLIVRATRAGIIRGALP
jgi:type I restriction enzyme R subunit